MIKPRVIVTDMDETMVNITPKWFKLILENIDAYTDIISRPKDDTIELLLKYPSVILLRADYPISRFFKLRDDLEISDEAAHSELNTRFLKLLDDEDFYMDLPINPFMEGLIPAIESKDKVDKLIILTLSSSPTTDRAKMKFIKHYFGDNNNKVELVSLRLGDSKSEFLSINPYGTFADDSFDTIIDVLENDKVERHELIIPLFPYNITKIKENKDKLDELLAKTNTDLNFVNNSMPLETIEELNEYNKVLGELAKQEEAEFSKPL